MLSADHGLRLPAPLVWEEEEEEEEEEEREEEEEGGVSTAPTVRTRSTSERLRLERSRIAREALLAVRVRTTRPSSRAWTLRTCERGPNGVEREKVGCAV